MFTPLYLALLGISVSSLFLGILIGNLIGKASKFTGQQNGQQNDQQTSRWVTFKEFVESDPSINPSKN